MRAGYRQFLLMLPPILAGCTVSPEPLTTEALNLETTLKIEAVDAEQEPLARPIDLYEAMARALKYNLENQVERARTNLKNAELNVANLDLLPDAATNAGYAARNNRSASSSLNLESGTQNFGASTSQDRNLKTADLTFGWNVLDFGLSYVRAKQAADRALINEELERKVAHRLLEDVRTAYWRTVSYERLRVRLQDIESRANNAIAETRVLSKERDTSPLTALMNERDLTDIKQLMHELQGDLIVAREQLGALMNVRPGTQFRVRSDRPAHAPQSLPMQESELMPLAVRNRPELRENIYQQRINMLEAEAALLQLLPGVQLYAGPEADSNSFLLNNSWMSWGAKASWNLLQIFQYPARQQVIEIHDEVLRKQALALTMSVMTQVSISCKKFRHLSEESKIAQDQKTVQKRIVDHMTDEVSAGRISELVLLREEMKLLVAEEKMDISRTNLQSAYANILASIGTDPYGFSDISLPVRELSISLEAADKSATGITKTADSSSLAEFQE